MVEKYNSADDTKAHVNRVHALIHKMISLLTIRAMYHDVTKLGPQEKPVFDEVTPSLKKLTYGSEEYNKSLEKMGTALEHHYAHNDHHPEHHPDGINDMSLLSIMEMLMDWKAASERHEDGDIFKSIEHNTERFGLDNVDFPRILRNTIEELFSSNLSQDNP